MARCCCGAYTRCMSDILPAWSKSTTGVWVALVLTGCCLTPGAEGSRSTGASAAGSTSVGSTGDSYGGAGTSGAGGTTSDCLGCLPPAQGPGLCLADGGPPDDCPIGSPCPGWCIVDGGVVNAAVPCPAPFLVASPCPGWCPVDDGGLNAVAPCPDHCAVDGGLNAPAVPCDGGCGWIGDACPSGSISSCCAGLACSPEEGSPTACCEPDGFPCSLASASNCCGESCSSGVCASPPHF